MIGVPVAAFSAAGTSMPCGGEEPTSGLRRNLDGWSGGNAAEPDAACLGEPLAWILNRLDHGVFLVGADARVAFANRAAENLLQAQRGLRLCGGVLKTDRAGETRALHDAIVTCTRTGDALDCHGFLVVTRGHGTPPLSCCVLRLPDARRDATPFGPVALLLFADPSGLPLPSARQLQTCFGLTAAEAALAVEVLVGDGLQACAKRLGISHTTARTHLGHIFEKTGTKRQAELVRVLLGVRAGIRLP